MKIDMTPVESSMLTHHGYDPETGRLRVQFKNKQGVPGDVWEYDGVSPEKYAAFTGSNSHGGFFLKKIKSHHAARKVG